VHEPRRGIGKQRVGRNDYRPRNESGTVAGRRPGSCPLGHARDRQCRRERRLWHLGRPTRPRSLVVPVPGKGDLLAPDRRDAGDRTEGDVMVRKQTSYARAGVKRESAAPRRRVANRSATATAPTTTTTNAPHTDVAHLTRAARQPGPRTTWHPTRRLWEPRLAPHWVGPHPPTHPSTQAARRGRKPKTGGVATGQRRSIQTSTVSFFIRFPAKPGQAHERKHSE